MKNHWERNLCLPIIRSKKTAKEFAELCNNRDWGHTYGLDQNNQVARVAWMYRKSINQRIREIRKNYMG